jgi:hypothetical protein
VRQLWGGSQRGLSTDIDGEENARVRQLAEEIMHLNLLEIADLTDILQKRLGLDAPGVSQMQFAQPAAGDWNLLLPILNP